MQQTKKIIPSGNFALLNAPNPKGERCIYLRYYLGKYVKKSTDIWVFENDWDDQYQCVRPGNKMHVRINNRLTLLKREIDEKLMDCDEELTPALLRSIVDGQFQIENKEAKQTTLVDYAHKVNDMLYAKKDYGYTAWYNKKSYIDAFSTFEEFFLKQPHVVLSKLKVGLFNQYIDYRFKVKKNTNREGINKTLIPLYTAIKDAVNNGLIENKDVAPILGNFLDTRETEYKAEVEVEEKIKYLTEEQLKSLHEYQSNVVYQRTAEILDMFFFCFYACGMRLSDMMTLEWHHIDWDNKVIKKMQFKTKRMPDILTPLCDEAIEILERWKSYKRNKRFVFDLLPEDYNIEDQQRLFMDRNSKDKTFNRSLRAISINAKMPFNVTMHVARHSFAVMAINRGVTLYMVSKLMGHSSIVATEKTYAQFLKEKVQEDVKTILNMNLGN